MRIKKTSGMFTAVCGLALVLLLGPSSAVASTTPTVCDDLSGRANRLCHDFCEELDCDWDPNAPGPRCDNLRFRYSSLTGDSEFPCETMSLGCVTGDSGADPPFPFDVGDGNDYGNRILELTAPMQCACDPSDSDCAPCPIVVGFHGYGEDGRTWKMRLEPKGRAVGFISLYPTGDVTPNSYDPDGSWGTNWAAPSCQDPNDGCLDGENCDWCGDWTEDDAVSTRREIDFTRAIIKWTMDNHCVDPGRIFATGFSNGALWAHTLARHPDTSGLFKAVVPVDGVDQAGNEDPLKWVYAPQDGDSPRILHVNEIFDNFEPYDGRPYDDWAAYGVPTWIYPPVLSIFAEYAAENDGYSSCGFDPDDVGDRFGVMDVGGVVPEGYRTLPGLEGVGQNKFHCFTRDAEGGVCENLAICLWDSGPAGDDYPDPHSRAGREWTGGRHPGTGGVKPMDIMWRFMQGSVGVPY